MPPETLGFRPAKRYAGAVSAERLCEGCGQPLLGAARADRRYHGMSCRKLGFRRRQHEREATDSEVATYVPSLDPNAVLEEATSEPRLLICIAKAAAQGNWRAAAWVLERRYPERWARGVEPELTSPRDPDPFAEVDELARRRRRHD